jgi:hypothetical protein
MPQPVLLGISLEGWLTLAAIIIGPIIALALQRDSERRRNSEARKLAIFKELMATRAARVSQRHVDALNAIEMEFSSGRGSDKVVARAWRVYLDHLNEHFDADDKDRVARWVDKSRELLADLLFEMSKALNFDFDKVSLKKGVYSPRAHEQLESDQELLRKFLLEVIQGNRPLWTGVFTGNAPLKMELVQPTPAPPELIVPVPSAEPERLP